MPHWLPPRPGETFRICMSYGLYSPLSLPSHWTSQQYNFTSLTSQHHQHFITATTQPKPHSLLISILSYTSAHCWTLTATSHKVGVGTIFLVVLVNWSKYIAQPPATTTTFPIPTVGQIQSKRGLMTSCGWWNGGVGWQDFSSLVLLGQINDRVIPTRLSRYHGCT